MAGKATHRAGSSRGPPRVLRDRIERIRRPLYGLYDEARYFLDSEPEERAGLRAGLDWPEVGHITSLLRALAEEERFSDWARFNSMMKAVRREGRRRAPRRRPREPLRLPRSPGVRSA